MAEYIKRADAMKICQRYRNHCFKTIDAKGQDIAERIEDNIIAIPTADVVEVRHGEWIGVADYGNGNCIGYCSVCGTTHKAENASELKCFQRYCKWCGAKMDGGKAE